MKLISCDKCGVVLDMDKLIFPDIRDEEGEFIEENSVWDGDCFRTVTPCPVCSGPILEED